MKTIAAHIILYLVASVTLLLSAFDVNAPLMRFICLSSMLGGSYLPQLESVPENSRHGVNFDQVGWILTVLFGILVLLSVSEISVFGLMDSIPYSIVAFLVWLVLTSLMVRRFRGFVGSQNEVTSDRLG